MLSARQVLGDELNDIYLYESFRTFGLQLISVFIPIHIAASGFGLLYVLGFLMIEQLTSILLSLPVSRMVAEKGFKRALLISYVFLLPGLLLIRGDFGPATIAASALLYGLAKIFHGISYESEFAVSSDTEDRSKQAGVMIGLPNISRFLGPLAGGFILSYLGFSFLLATSILFFLVSLAVLFQTRDHRDPMNYSLKTMVKDNIRKAIPVFFLRGVLNIAAIALFSLMIYYQISGVVDVGIVNAVDNLGVIAASLISGALAAKIGEKRVILVGGVLSSLVHFGRIIVTTPLQAALISGIGGITFMIYEVPLFSKYADTAEKEDILEFYTLKRIFFKAGQLSTLLLVLVASRHSLDAAFNAAFAAAGLCAIAMIYFSEKEW